ncbi:hypothetical protein GQ457_15G008900 [Hibiscus cannabinus]
MLDVNAVLRSRDLPITIYQSSQLPIMISHTVIMLDANNPSQDHTYCPKALDMANGNHHQATKNDDEWQLDCLLHRYGLPVIGDVNQKRKFAMGAHLPLAFKA